MPFNSDSYYRNKWRREALEYLEKAREMKATPGNPLREELFPGSRDADMRFFVARARSAWRLYLGQCRIIAIMRGE